MSEEAQDKTDDVVITRKSYERLIQRDDFLSCLEGAGVDNWSGYEYAQEMLEE